METARQLHADDFQLVTPLGAVFSKEECLEAVAAGVIHCLAVELDSPIAVRMYENVALLRYRSQIEVEVQGQRYPRAPYWSTDASGHRVGPADLNDVRWVSHCRDLVQLPVAA